MGLSVVTHVVLLKDVSWSKLEFRARRDTKGTAEIKKIVIFENWVSFYSKYLFNRLDGTWKSTIESNFCCPTIERISSCFAEAITCTSYVHEGGFMLPGCRGSWCGYERLNILLVCDTRSILSYSLYWVLPLLAWGCLTHTKRGTLLK